MVATEEELIKYNLPLDKRDYCAHLYINWLKCRKETFPLLYQCDHNKHQYSECEFDDFVLRMKEYERERRLKKRAKRIKAKQLVEEME